MLDENVGSADQDESRKKSKETQDDHEVPKFEVVRFEGEHLEKQEKMGGGDILVSSRLQSTCSKTTAIS